MYVYDVIHICWQHFRQLKSTLWLYSAHRHRQNISFYYAHTAYRW